MRERKGVHFISTTVIGGLLFLVPVVFLVYVVTQAVGFMMVIAQPMAEFIPVDTIGGVALANLIAVAAVILVSFLAGLLARNALASGFMQKLESKLLKKIPGYTLIRGIKGSFDDQSPGQFRPVAVMQGATERIGLETQKLADGRSMIFIPGVPNGLSGITQIVPADQLTYLDGGISNVIELSERYGDGVEELLAKRIETPPAGPGRS
jgi:uncharacterized membrane protein